MTTIRFAVPVLALAALLTPAAAGHARAPQATALAAPAASPWGRTFELAGPFLPGGSAFVSSVSCTSTTAWPTELIHGPAAGHRRPGNCSRLPAETLGTSVCCRNPFLAAERARKRDDLLAATEAGLAKVKDAVAAGRLKDPDKIGIRADRVINKHKVARHFLLDISPGRFAWRRDQETIAAEAALAGSASSAPASPATPSTDQAWSPPARISSTSSGTSASPSPTTPTLLRLTATD